MTVAGRVTCLSQPPIPLLDFLEQFHDVEARWPLNCRSPIKDFIAKCAKFQETLLKDTPHSHETLPKGSLLIALTLRCLVLTQESSLVHEPRLRDRPLHSPNGLCYWPIERYDDLDPIIEVSESPESGNPSSDIPDQSCGQNISSMFEDLLHIIQSVMMRRKSQDWPALFFTLCLLYLTVHVWRGTEFFATSLDRSYNALEQALCRLCDLFEIISKGFLPLQERWPKPWPKEAYSKLVDDKDHLVEAFQWAHDIWLNSMFSNYREITRLDIRRRLYEE